MKILLGLLLFVFCLHSNGQDTITFELIGEYELSGYDFCSTSIFNRNDDAYIYSASPSLGLITFDTSDLTNPFPIDTILTSSFAQQRIQSLVQREDRLYIALGGLDDEEQGVGMAIVSIEDPSHPVLLTNWISDSLTGGAAIVKVQGDYAFLGGMAAGLVIMNIENEFFPEQVSNFVPDPSWPGIVEYSPNARGMEVVGDLLYLCYDVGGIRTIDISDKEYPFQLDQYANFEYQGNHAYNNILVKDGYAYTPTDYCGVEILDLSDAEDIDSVYWYNPWECNGFSWFGSAGHTNEIVLDEEEKNLFISAGQTEFIALNIEDPEVFVPNGSVALDDSAAVWGIDYYNGHILASFIDNSAFVFFQPYYSDYGGIKIYQPSYPISVEEVSLAPNFELFPNPATDYIELKGTLDFEIKIEIRNINGQLIDCNRYREKIDVSSLDAGIYLLNLIDGKGNKVCKRFIKL